MDFKIKTFNEILDNMANWIRTNSKRLTNLRVGSVVRTISESVALEIELLYYKMLKGFNIATEEAIFNSFDFTQVQSSYAQGEVTVFFRRELLQPVVIPKGFKVMVPGTQWNRLTFVTTEEVVCEIGLTETRLPIQCTEPGEIGNVMAGAITVVLNPLTVIDRVVNEEALAGGYPAESLEERKKRFTHYIQTLAKGTLGAVHYGCLSVPSVAGAYIEEHVGFLEIYAHNVNGLLPDTVKKELEIVLRDYRSAGVEVHLKPVNLKKVDLDVFITLSRTVPKSKVSEYEGIVKKSLIDYLNSYSVSRDLLRADLILFIRSISSSLITNTELGLENDLIVNSTELVRPGDINVHARIE